MSDDEDDYLSDKFLVAAASASTSAAPKTYAQRRKEAQAAAAARNAENRTLSARAAREDALSRSLFERAQEETRESGQQNKALAMMMKMGFRPGQALGKEEEDAKAKKGEEDGHEEAGGSGAPAEPAQVPEEEEVEPRRAGIGARHRMKVDADEEAEKSQATTSGHRTVPIGISEWEGKKGIGLRKRAASPSAPERRAKMAKMAEDRDHTSFRDRARAEYEERRAVGQLGPAQRTCATLDEKAGIEFNVLWLSPEHPETFPEGLLDALDDPVLVATIQRQRADHSLEGRLRAKMQADALRPLKSSLDDVDADADAGDADKTELRKAPYSEEELEEALQFLRLNPRDRRTLVLDYLRRKYTYCFWCGTQYDGLEDMESNCPGAEEDAHD